MPLEFDKQETADFVSSLRRFFRDELEVDLSEMQAGFLLNYFLKEIAPTAYNRGVRDAEGYFRGRVEELSAVCFEEPMTFWTKRRK